MSARRLGWGIWGACLVLAATSVAFLLLNGAETHSASIGEPVVEQVLGLVYIIFPTVGALIVARQPRNPIGWLFLLAGLGFQVEDALVGYATYTLLENPGALPGGALAALAADVIWIPVLQASITLLLLLFPTGRLPSRRWRILVWILAADAAVYVLSTLLNPGPLYYFDSVHNPLGIEGAGDVLSPVVNIVGGPAILTTLAALVALGVRFRRSSGLERQQLKWLVYAGGLLVALTPVMIVLGESEVSVAGIVASDLLYGLVIALIPLAVGTAILRHRLYDIDVVINRTLVYGALTATLLGAYLGLVLLFQLVLSPLTEQSDLAIAGSTLAVAALFRPLRGAHPGAGGPPLLPAQVRRPAHARWLRRPRPRRGRARLAQRGPARCGGGDHATEARVAVAAMTSRIALWLKANR